MQKRMKLSWLRWPGGRNAEICGKTRRATTGAMLSALLVSAFMSPLLAEEPEGKDLKTFYQQNCSRCHGADGSATSAEGKKLQGQDFTDPAWLRTARDSTMVQTILKGKFFGLAMPGFSKTLTKDEAQRMVTDVIRKSEKGVPIAP